MSNPTNDPPDRAPSDPPGWGPPPPGEPTTQYQRPDGQLSAQSGSQWPTQAQPAQPAAPPYAQPGPSYPQSGPPYEQSAPPYGASGPAPNQPFGPAQPAQQYGYGSYGSGTQWAGLPNDSQQGGPPRKKSNKKLFVILAAVLAVVLVGGGLFFFLSGDDITYQGRDIVEPEKVLSDSETTLDGIVDERNGATSDDTSCYFVAKNADTTDIQDRLVCGPVLFVDGDDSAQYLTFPLQAGAGDGDARLTVAAEPDSPEPAELADRDLLRRPDGASPPDGNGGVATPDPPRADEGIFAVVPSDGIELEAAPASARVGSPTMSIVLSRIGEPDRYGQGDDARRPADGQRFVAFELTGGPGELGPTTDFALAVEVDGDDPESLPDDADLSSGSVPLVLSVAEDTEEVTLVVSEGSLVQRLSLTSGDPDPDNVALWQRANRGQQLGFSQPLTVRLSQPGFVTEDFPVVVSVRQVDLLYFAGPNLASVPSSPSQAFLDLDSVVDVSGQPGAVDPAFWSLTLPDGTVLPAIDLVDDPNLISIAFEVAASFTEGTLTFGGVLTQPDGLTIDFLGAIATIPIAIEAD